MQETHAGDVYAGDACRRCIQEMHAGDVGLITESGGSPRGGNGDIPQYSCLENKWVSAWFKLI